MIEKKRWVYSVLPFLLWGMVGCQAFLERPSKAHAHAEQESAPTAETEESTHTQTSLKTEALSQHLVQIEEDSSGPNGSMPRYAEAVQRLQNTVKHTPLHMPSRFRINKKDSLYELCWLLQDSLEHWQPHTCLTFWSPTRGYHYRSLAFGESQGTPSPIEEEDLWLAPASSDRLAPHDIYRFYGYEGWRDDHDRYYRAHPPKTATDHYAAALLTQDLYTEYAFAHADRLMLSFRSKALEEWLNAVEQTAQHYRDALAAPSNTPTFAGSVEAAFAQERTHALLLARMLGLEEVAERLLAEAGGHPASTLSLAAQVLNSCPPNSLLFGMRSNLFYPLFYLQQRYNSRPDVLLLQTDFLDQPTYLDHLQNPIHYPEAALSIALTKEGYHRQPALVHCHNSDSTLSVDSLKQLIAALNAPPENDPARFYFSEEIRITAPNGTTMDRIAPPHTWGWRQLLSLAIFSANINERPILMTRPLAAQTTPQFLTPTLQRDYTEMLGPVYRLTTTPNKAFLSEEGRALNHTYFNKRTSRTPVEILHEGDRALYTSYFRALFQLLTHFEEQGDLDRASDILGAVIHHYHPVLPDYPQEAAAFLDWSHQWDLIEGTALLFKNQVKRLQYLTAHIDDYPEAELDSADASPQYALRRRAEALVDKAHQYNLHQEDEALQRLLTQLVPSQMPAEES